MKKIEVTVCVCTTFSMSYFGALTGLRLSRFENQLLFAAELVTYLYAMVEQYAIHCGQKHGNDDLFESDPTVPMDGIAFGPVN